MGNFPIAWQHGNGSALYNSRTHFWMMETLTITWANKMKAPTC